MEFDRTPAVALIAYANDILLGNEVSPGNLDVLIKAVCKDQASRVELLRALKEVNDDSVKPVVEDLIRQFQQRYAADADEQDGLDKAGATWLQAMTVPLGLFLLGTVAVGNLAGIPAIISGSGVGFLLVFSTFGRYKLLGRRMKSKRVSDSADSLLKLIIAK